jgi:hypothetical protein
VAVVWDRPGDLTDNIAYTRETNETFFYGWWKTFY